MCSVVFATGTVRGQSFTDCFSYDPHLEISVPKPGCKGYRNVGPEKIQMSFNSKGYRGPDAPSSTEHRDPGLVVVAVVGSKMFGSRLDERHLPSRFLEAKLNELAEQNKRAVRFKVFNLAKPGFGPGRNSVVASLDAFHVRPDIVVYNVAPGDLLHGWLETKALTLQTDDKGKKKSAFKGWSARLMPGEIELKNDRPSSIQSCSISAAVSWHLWSLGRNPVRAANQLADSFTRNVSPFFGSLARDGRVFLVWSPYEVNTSEVFNWIPGLCRYGFLLLTPSIGITGRHVESELDERGYQMIALDRAFAQVVARGYSTDTLGFPFTVKGSEAWAESVARSLVDDRVFQAVLDSRASRVTGGEKTKRR